ncbi:MAG: sialate O-acetylesterase [Puniceicoccales bacterium]|jgi:sialate O-acetylesterase|nr:sialate O-acetylesterase [Puniceicoccales bacterium]
MKIAPRLIPFLALSACLCFVAQPATAQTASPPTAAQAQPAAVALKLAAPFGDFMVLQRGVNVPVWGTARSGAEVSVSFAGQKKTTRADDAGKWEVRLAPLTASATGRVLAVSDGAQTVEFKDVLVGEVWICSGQSNMEQGIVNGSTRNGRADADAADYPLIRIRFVHKVGNIAPQTNLPSSGWQPCSPASIRNGTWGGFSAAGYFFGSELFKALNVPVGLIQTAWGGTRIEPWTPPVGFASVHTLAHLGRPAARFHVPGSPMSLYNAMIHPLVPYAFRGAIWYQGESNLGEANYAQKTRALVNGWREVWKQGDFPFYFVQLAPYIYDNNAFAEKRPGLLPLSWEQQNIAATTIPNVGMAIINDVGNLRDIHPGDKRTVGARLARLALSRTYGKQFTDDCGPLFKSATIAGPQKIVVEFNNALSGLTTRDGKTPDFFELAGKDGIFHPATTAVIVGKTVEVTCEELTAVKQVRFAWRQDASPNLTNGEKIPASAFRWPTK